ncbi:glycosyltransferase family 2 protein [Ancylobacter sonchi]|uniref:glycosyltransferase family 2 protein n=1 Tax=Ancylobacter sonchi TaxID=1937790 RepID=UPI001BD29F01|nr:glycosyltransferase family 2 protein [Ancylobacter sonchi]MBS7532216.1 glycosyltransferase family 2 protein [Ancylobacter sonchi]
MNEYAPNQTAYRNWREHRRLQLTELHLDQPSSWNKLISVAIDCTASSADQQLDSTLKSLLEQDWNNLEISVFSASHGADIDRDPFMKLRGLQVHEAMSHDDLLRLGPTRCDLRGDYILMVPAGVTFDETAFSSLNRALVQSGGTHEPDLVIFDHEYLDESGQKAYPAFLPGFDPDFLAEEDYIGHGVLLKASLFDRLAAAGPLASLREFMLAAAQCRPAPIVAHVRDVLMTVHGRLPGDRPLSGANAAPALITSAAVAVVIPNRNKPDLLQQCVRSLSTEKAVRELIVVDNASDDARTLELYDDLRRDHGARIVPMDQPFNFSRMINLGVAASESELVLLLNNDIEFRQPGALDAASALAMRPEIGIVGSKLLYPDFTVQHAGVLLEYHPFEYHVRALHVGRGAETSSAGYLGQYAHLRNYQAVTGAFMMLRRSVFDEANGFDEVALPVEFNDIDFCLRVRHAGYKIVCAPFEGVFHHESASRGKADTPSVIEMRRAAQGLMARRWIDEFKSDPFNHPIARLGERAEVQFNFTGTFVG